jgi:hypothetical protein
MLIVLAILAFRFHAGDPGLAARSGAESRLAAIVTVA